jgi:lipid A 3-O-deacylase
MRPAFLNLIFVILLGALSAGARADAWDRLMADYQKVSVEGRSTHIVDVDNDSLLLNKNDGFYTSGLRYTNRRTIATQSGTSSFGWRIGQELYTASDIKLPPELVGPPNHPYAGWLFGGVFKEENRRDGSYTRFGLDIGCLGPCAGGKATQKTLHRILNQPQPRGWSKQIRNEPGVVLHGEVAPARWMFGSSVDLATDLHFRFGNIVTDAGVGAMVRAGRLNLLPNGPGFHGFVRGHINAVGYNASLQGGYFSNDNPHTVAPKRWVGAAEIGVAWLREKYGFKASLVRQSNEIRALRESVGAQDFVRLQFIYTPG